VVDEQRMKLGLVGVDLCFVFLSALTLLVGT